MFKMKRRSMLGSTGAATAVAALPKLSHAQSGYVSPPYGPDDLKGVLTPFGGIRAGNADGTIPPWTGGYSTVSPGYVQGDPRPDPFADEKPSFSITSANLAKYQDKLAAGAVALLQKYPDFRLDVYATHRTAIAPQYVYDYIYKNATNAQLILDGNGVEGAYGGIPFPIPKNGYQVMWNHLLSWVCTTSYEVTTVYSVTSTGEVVFQSRERAWNQYPYYFENNEGEPGVYSYSLILPTAPPYQAGGAILVNANVNPQVTPNEGFVYLLGERRTRLAPELQYDTPNSLTGGVINWDESYLFSGKLDKYDLVLLGKKEMYVPYNMNKVWISTVEEQFGPRFFNPDISRWELHRVWVVEMTLKSGARNVDTRRIGYFDEDTGAALMFDVYDGSGSLWKFGHCMPTICADIPALVARRCNTWYDLHAQNYAVADIPNASTQPQYKIIPRLPSSFFAPGELSVSAGGY